MLLTLTSEFRVLKRKACGVQWRSPGGGVGGEALPTNLYFLLISAKSWMHYKDENTKSIISQELRISQQNSRIHKSVSERCTFYEMPKKMSKKSLEIINKISNSSKNKNWFSALRICYVKMATNEEGGGRGGGLHILSWETAESVCQNWLFQIYDWCSLNAQLYKVDNLLIPKLNLQMIIYVMSSFIMLSSISKLCMHILTWYADFIYI